MTLFGLGQSALDKGLEAFAARGWKRARKWLEDAMEQEQGGACAYHLGLLYWRGLGGPTDKRAAAECFRIAAEHNHTGGKTAYAIALRSGVGVARDVEAARALFRAAALDAGDTEAMAQLATLSEPEEARRLLTRAAERGHIAAMRYLSDLIMRHDPVEALAWLYAAAALVGDHSARKRASALARELDAREIEEAQKAGRAYARNILDAAKDNK